MQVCTTYLQTPATVVQAPLFGGLCAIHSSCFAYLSANFCNSWPPKHTTISNRNLVSSHLGWNVAEEDVLFQEEEEGEEEEFKRDSDWDLDTDLNSNLHPIQFNSIIFISGGQLNERRSFRGDMSYDTVKFAST